MVVLGTMVGIGLGLKNLNGKTLLELKKSKSAKGGIIALVLMYGLGLTCLVIGLIDSVLDMILAGSFLLFCLSYLLYLSPLFQRSKNYTIDFVDLGNFTLYYKGREVNIKYKLDEEGKFLFLDDSNKHRCISYADGSRMSSTKQYRIMNYFSKWLQDYDLMSKHTTFSLEH